MAGGTAVAFALVLLVAGCSRTTDEQPRPGSCPPLVVVEWTPAGLSTGIATNTDIKLTFSGYPDPDTVDGSDVILSSGIFTRFGSYDVDLISRSVRFRPYSQLTSNVTYMVTLLSDVRSLQGCEARQEQRTFETGDGPTATPAPPEPPTSAAVLPILAASCGGNGCHRQSPVDGGGCLSAPAKGLSLCDADAYDALVGESSRELASMKRVVPSDPARSYLLRKLIAPDDAPIVPGTPGQRMPPGPPLEEAQLRTISDWIAGGALR
jgi:hypothetical protein